MQADRVALLWDASKSREIRNEKDMQIIKTYVQKVSESLRIIHAIKLTF
jgi:hypothetical protein